MIIRNRAGFFLRSNLYAAAVAAAILLAGCGSRSPPPAAPMVSKTSGTVSSDPAPSPRSDWTSSSQRSAMDGDILRVSKEFGDKDSRITAQISCKVATEELSVTIKARDADKQPKALLAHRDDKGDRYPTGRLKSKNTTPIPLD
jgi:major membrane immunogen (membrane-anchored lipoprotein)